MRLMVLFDLPTGNKKERKSYAEFRKFLIHDGYHCVLSIAGFGIPHQFFSPVTT